MNTYELVQRKNKLLFHIEQQMGELESGDWDDLTALDALIAESYQDSALMVVNKVYGEQIAKIKEAKDTLDAAIEQIKKVEERMKFQVHQHLMEHGPMEIEIDGQKRFLKAGNTVRNIIDQEAVHIDKRKYTVEVTNRVMEKIRGKDGVGEEKRKNNILKDFTEEEKEGIVSQQLNPQIKLLKKI